MSATVSRSLFTQQARQIRRLRWLNQHHPSYLLDRRRQQQPSSWKPRCFSTTSFVQVVKPYLLADIGEGITECQIIQWFVQPGAHVQQFDKICEVQSDKAAVERSGAQKRREQKQRAATGIYQASSQNGPSSSDHHVRPAQPVMRDWVADIEEQERRDAQRPQPKGHTDNNRHNNGQQQNEQPPTGPRQHGSYQNGQFQIANRNRASQITSRFDGVIKRLHYAADDMARVGKPLVDIDIKGDIAPEDEALLKTNGDVPKAKETPMTAPSTADQQSKAESSIQSETADPPDVQEQAADPSTSSHGKYKSLATPAVRHMIKEHNLNIEDIPGTGKDGRVLKEDIQKYASSQGESRKQQQQQQQPPTSAPAPTQAIIPSTQDKVIQITGIRKKMYETMTKSLSIPHFLYTDTVDFTSLNTVRRSINSHEASSVAVSSTESSPGPKLSALPFIIKAISLSFTAFPSLNAHLETFDRQKPPQLTYRSAHNIGVAIDTPQGLVVPVLKNVQSQSIFSIAREITRLGALARDNKLSSSDLSDATFTVSNIGSIGGTAVAPVIVSPQVAIVGVGKARAVPAFNEKGEVVRKEECVFSWSADHRVVDGATVARCAEMVRGYLEGTERMLVRLR